MFHYDRIFIIAEAGVNYNGDLSLAFRLIDQAAECGANAVKFQSFKAELLVKQDIPQQTYQTRNSGSKESQFKMLKRLELTMAQTKKLQEHACQRNIEFLSTPYDESSVDMLDEIGINTYKIGSADITNLPLLQHVAQKRKTIILSTAASTMNEVREAVDSITSINSDLVLLHCTSCYPAQLEDVNLNAMTTLMREFSLPVGYSDHTLGNTISIAAATLGAKVIEKHFTLERGLPGPDHKASVEPKDLRKLVQAVRDVEKALGSFEKKPCSSELETVRMGRRSLLTRHALRKGQLITRDMIVAKRPGIGISPKNLEQVIGRRVARDLAEDHILTLEDFDV